MQEDRCLESSNPRNPISIELPTQFRYEFFSWCDPPSALNTLGLPLLKEGVRKEIQTAEETAERLFS